MYTELIQRCKQMYLTESDGDDDNSYQLPSFLDSIASVLIHLDKVKIGRRQTLEILSFNILLLLKMMISLQPLLCVHSPRSQRCIHHCWNASLLCRLTAFLSTARGCRLPVAGPSWRCWWPWRLKDPSCGVLSAQWVCWTWTHQFGLEGSYKERNAGELRQSP